MTDRNAIIVFVVFPGFKLLDLTGPLQVFADARVSANAQPFYQCVIVSLEGGAIVSDAGLSVQTVAISTIQDTALNTLLVVGGNYAEQEASNESLVKAIRELDRESLRTGSVCTGAFILAAGGLLENKRAVTHWKLCRRLSVQYSNVQVEENPIYIQDGKIWTSAGVTAGIDLALAMVAQDLSRVVALRIARNLVTFMLRPGGQSQFSQPLFMQHSDAGGVFDKLVNWILKNISRKISVEDMASYMNMSPRTFARLFVKHTGMTPAKAVILYRIDAAKLLLEDSSHAIYIIAQKCGFGTEEAMRRAFQNTSKLSPKAYRERFGQIKTIS